MKELRRLIYQSMVKFIIRSTPYTLADIAEVIQETHMKLNSIMQDHSFPTNKHTEMNLITLYSIALDLYYFCNAHGIKDHENNES